MKRLIRCDTQYQALKKIRDDYNSKARRYDESAEARINREHHCVDVYVDGKLVEQRYASHNGKNPSVRVRYEYVGQGKGDYKQVKYPVSETDYTDSDPYIKVMK